MPNYSWTINVVTHEFGHIFGSSHTHDCAWNGNYTQIDDCGNLYYYINPSQGSPEPCFNNNNPIIPTYGGTIMSYCHLNSTGVNFSLGFGLQPGNVIRDRIGSCLGNCDCQVYRLVTGNVNNGNYDEKYASHTVQALNQFQTGTSGDYHGGKEVILKPGFNAKPGSSFRAYVEGCDSGKGLDSQEISVSSSHYIDYTKPLQVENELLEIYPNPTNGYINLESNKAIARWEVLNEFGNIYNKGNVSIENANNAQFDISSYPTGIYFVRTTFKDGEIIMKTVIKE